MNLAQIKTVWVDVEKRKQVKKEMQIIPRPPEATSVFSCPKCGNWVDVEGDQRIRKSSSWHCIYCKEYLTRDYSYIAVNWESIPLMDEQTALYSTWYHATTRPDWYNGITMNNAVTHIGTYVAARHKFDGIYFTSSKWLYKLRLKPDVLMHPDISDDLNCWPTQVWDAPLVDLINAWHEGEITPRGAVRYVNRYEDPGSISILCDPSVIEVVDFEYVRSNDV